MINGKRSQVGIVRLSRSDTKVRYLTLMGHSLKVFEARVQTSSIINHTTYLIEQQ